MGRFRYSLSCRLGARILDCSAFAQSERSVLDRLGTEEVVGEVLTVSDGGGRVSLAVK